MKKELDENSVRIISEKNKNMKHRNWNILLLYLLGLDNGKQ